MKKYYSLLSFFITLCIFISSTVDCNMANSICNTLSNLTPSSMLEAKDDIDNLYEEIKNAKEGNIMRKKIRQLTKIRHPKVVELLLKLMNDNTV